MKKKVVFKEISRCDDCPYFHHQSQPEYKYSDKWESWYECGFTDKIIIGMKELIELKGIDDFEFPIPDWCPLEDYDLFHKAIDIVRSNNE